MTVTDAQIIDLDVTGLSPSEINDIRSHVRSKQPGPATYLSPEHGWTCFHCGQTFHTQEGAKLHFGGSPNDLPACRKMARELETLRAALAAAQAGNEMRAFGASHVACYKWPDDTPEHRVARAAFCEGAAQAGANEWQPTQNHTPIW